MRLSRSVDMTEGPIARHLINFAAPMLIGLIFQQLYNTVDTIVVGNFVSSQALAAVGVSGPLISTLLGFFNGFSTGATVVIARCFGARDHKGVQNAVHTTILVTLLMAIVFTGAGTALAPALLRLMRAPDDMFEEASIYFRIYFEGVIGLMLYNMGAGILRAVGDSRRPLLFLMLSALLNTVLDLFFVLVLGMKVDGVALATVLAQVISAAAILFVLTREKAAYGIRWKELRVDRGSLSGILKIGLPSSIQSAITAFSNVFVQSYINAFGSACMAGYSIYNKLDAFVLIPVQALAMSSTTMVGQNWGAKQTARARKSVSTAIWLSLISTALLGIVAFLAAKDLIGLFSPDPEVVSYGVRFIQIVTPFYLTISFNQIYSGALRGIGDATAPTVIMLCSFVVFRQIYLFITKMLNIGFVSVALAYPMGWILCSTLLIIRYRGSRLFREGNL